MREMSSLDLKLLLKELKDLEGSRIQKSFQKSKQLRVEIFTSGKGVRELFFEPNRLFLTDYKRKAGQAESFAMVLRKHLSGKKITEVSQHGFDRILEVKTEDNVLIFEMFSKGNVILCDSKYKIIVPMEVQSWKSRRIFPRKQYKYPPETRDPFSFIPSELIKLAAKSKRNVVTFLAKDLSLSGLYAEEVCLRAKLDKKKPVAELGESEISNISAVIQELTRELLPQIILEDGKPADVVPFPMKYYADQKSKTTRTFSSALDEFFTGHESEQIVEEGMEDTKKLKRIEEGQKKAIAKWEKIGKESKAKADAIMNNFDKVQDVITMLNKSGKWDDKKKMLKKKKIVKEIREKEGRAVLKL